MVLALGLAALCIVVLWRKYRLASKLIRNLTEEEVEEFHLGKNGGNADGREISVEHVPFEVTKKIRREDLKTGSTVLGEGEFGIVYKGVFKEQNVAVKSSKSGADVEYFKAFLKEIKIMAFLEKHENIVQFYGAVVDEIQERRCLAVMELSPYGNLNAYLRIHSNRYLRVNAPSLPSESRYENEPQMALNIAVLMSYCEQIAAGMEFLSQKKVIHGDLAARNVLLFHNNVLKVTDFGLSRKLYSCKNYTKKNSAPLPWRWMAIESLRFLEFSTKSDVWSFGVTIWEIFSFSEVPFSGLNWTTDFSNQLESGFRLTKPQHCPAVVFNWVMKCWEGSAEQRPTFADGKAFFFNQCQNFNDNDSENVAHFAEA